MRKFMLSSLIGISAIVILTTAIIYRVGQDVEDYLDTEWWV